MRRVISKQNAKHSYCQKIVNLMITLTNRLVAKTLYLHCSCTWRSTACCNCTCVSLLNCDLIFKNLETFGGSRLRRTINVWEIKFQKRGPMATYSISMYTWQVNQHHIQITLKSSMFLYKTSTSDLPFNIIKRNNAQCWLVSILKHLK